MGYPAAPLLLLLLLRPAAPTAPTAPAAPCFTVPTASPTLDLTNKSRGCAELDWGPFQQQSQLWLSHNGIAALSPSARVAPATQKLDLSHNRLQKLPVAFLSRARQLQLLQLQHNQLQELPDGFFANATALQNLQLEGNPLPAVPRSAFHASLRSLTVSCRCDVVGSVLAPCACSSPNCTVPQCRCLTSHHNSSVADFHARECQGGVGLVAGLAGAASGVAVVLLVATTVVCYRRRKAAAAATGVGWGKWEPAAAHGQPRYISRAAEIGTADATATAAPDYENVFVSPCTGTAAAQGWTPAWQEERHSPQVPVDDNYFLESEAGAGDQPIYANTCLPGEDNVYIVPNH
ncbi:leucine-rich repeat-containing protein 25 [Phoenicopterus ruber ruber]